MRLVRGAIWLGRLMLGASLALAADSCAGEISGGDPESRIHRESLAHSARDPDAPVSRAGGASLTAAANNPLAPIPQIQFRFLSGKGFETPIGSANTLQIQPMIPIRPIGFLPPQLVRVTIPGDVVTSSGQDVSGLGNTQIVSIFAFEKAWGAWGVGPAFVLPSATTQRLQPQWQLGLAALAVYTGAKNWVLGALVQNLTSTFGSGEVSSNMLYIQPIVTYTLPHGWYVGLPDYNLSFNWRERGQATIPLGLQVGRVIKFSERFALNVDVEFGVPIVKPSGPGTPDRVLGIEVSLMFL